MLPWRWRSSCGAGPACPRASRYKARHCHYHYRYVLTQCPSIPWAYDSNESSLFATASYRQVDLPGTVWVVEARLDFSRCDPGNELDLKLYFHETVMVDGCMVGELDAHGLMGFFRWSTTARAVRRAREAKTEAPMNPWTTKMSLIPSWRAFRTTCRTRRSRMERIIRCWRHHRRISNPLCCWDYVPFCLLFCILVWTEKKIKGVARIATSWLFWRRYKVEQFICWELCSA